MKSTKDLLNNMRKQKYEMEGRGSQDSLPSQYLDVVEKNKDKLIQVDEPIREIHVGDYFFNSNDYKVYTMSEDKQIKQVMDMNTLPKKKVGEDKQIKQEMVMITLPKKKVGELKKVSASVFYSIYKLGLFIFIITVVIDIVNGVMKVTKQDASYNVITSVFGVDQFGTTNFFIIGLIIIGLIILGGFFISLIVNVFSRYKY